MLTIPAAITEGLVQGLTEFLPVSSSGHLVLLKLFAHHSDVGVGAVVCLHLGTALSVILHYRRELAKLVSAFFRRPTNWQDPEVRFVWLLGLATVTTIPVACLIDQLSDTTFSSGYVVGGSLLVTALLLWLSDQRRATGHAVFHAAVPLLLLVGAAQGMAALPGLSRSGATIAVLLFIGIEREEAARFSFLLSLPTILLGAVYLTLKAWHAGELSTGFTPTGAMTALLIGAAVAALSGYAAIRILIPLIKKARLRWFALYCLVLGAAVLAATAIGLGRVN